MNRCRRLPGIFFAGILGISSAKYIFEVAARHLLVGLIAAAAPATRTGPSTPAQTARKQPEHRKQLSTAGHSSATHKRCHQLRRASRMHGLAAVVCGTAVVWAAAASKATTRDSSSACSPPSVICRTGTTTSTEDQLVEGSKYPSTLHSMHAVPRSTSFCNHASHAHETWVW